MKKKKARNNNLMPNVKIKKKDQCHKKRLRKKNLSQPDLTQLTCHSQHEIKKKKNFQNKALEKNPNLNKKELKKRSS